MFVTVSFVHSLTFLAVFSIQQCELGQTKLDNTFGQYKI